MRKLFICACVMAILFTTIPIANAGTITETGVSQRDLVRYLTNIKTIVNELKADVNLLRGQVLNGGAASPAGLTFTYAATALTTSTYYYTINGVSKVFVASTNMVWTGGNLATQTTPTICNYLFGIDATGNLTVTKGTSVAIGSTPTLPALPALTAPLGYATVYATLNNFTYGSDSFMKPYVGATPTAYQLVTMHGTSGSSSAVTASDLSLVDP